MGMTSNELEIIMNKQRKYYVSGVTRSIGFRIMMLQKLYDAIERHEKEISEALHKDLRKPPLEAYVTEIGFVLSSITHTMKHLDEWMTPEKVKTPIHLQPATSFIVKEPYGIALVIGPFNYPLQLLLDPLVGAIAAGNCAVLKPSEDAPYIASLVEKLIANTFPSEYVTVVQGGKEETQLLLKAPFDYVFFTGSANVGKIVMHACAERLTPLTLELGGKSPVVVDSTADIRKAAEKIVWGKFLNTGQTCIAPDYVLADVSIYNQLLEEMKKAIERFYGKDAQKSADYGRIINERQYQRLVDILEADEMYIVEGGRTDAEDLYIEPTLLALPDWDQASMQEEIFGPILPVLPYESLGLAIQQISKLPKSLAAYFFTENDKAADHFIENLPFGGGCINDTISHAGNIHLPFGGVGPSGMNQYHGKASFETFSHSKSIMKKSTAVTLSVGYPPYKGKLPLVKRFIR
ncbi:aldehyde dehydrogenase [Sporosarcina sp. GW1-11]|uniref:aldehyde dehydrogenase n=1 Tax=Sporosarcina sp. GW1-11 TaxID=2899126 RepID=UPI00294E1773|nr:aldehyde dehydrogenase [Sporosarcina sp. GW1-11]MDV6376882.1 aldehyde dehydrogenase [Sporosarcina sp. GW1-11]